MQWTSFVCGIFYERFQPGGTRQILLGGTSGFDREGDYMMNCRTMTAEIPAFDALNRPNVTICMTAMSDVARFVTAALDMQRWPAEMTMCGDRLTVLELMRMIEMLKG